VRAAGVHSRDALDHVLLDVQFARRRARRQRPVDVQRQDGVDGPFSKSATRRTLDVSEEAVERVAELYERSKHKRAMPPAPEPL
jgi:NH3-dependent NAD+ synthetase